MEELGFRHLGFDFGVGYLGRIEAQLLTNGENEELLKECERCVQMLETARRQDPWSAGMMSWMMSNAILLAAWGECYARAGRGYGFN